MRIIVICLFVLLFHILLLSVLFRSDPDPGEPPAPPESAELEPVEKESRPAPPKPEITGPTMDYSGFSRPSQNLSGRAAELIDNCKTGLLVDWTNRRILWSKKADQPVPIASMTKMMTVLIMMERIEADPELSLQTEVRVTPAAAAVQGRQVWLDPRETFNLDQLLKITMMHSANDVAYLIAEFIGQGEVDSFVASMNQRARKLGFDQAEFVNPHGLDTRSDQPANRATAFELAWLASRLLDYPRVIEWASTWISSIRDEDPRFDRFELVNTNRLVRDYEGVSGIKTGYTRMAGFCLTATAERAGRQLIAVVTGCPSATERNELVKALLDWGWEQ